MWQTEPAVADWWTRMRSRPSVAAIFERMQEAGSAPWPKVQALLTAA
jgi:hypothetical protein